MPLHKPHHSTKPSSTSPPPPKRAWIPNPPPPNWRSQIKQSQLVSQISSTLLQRHNWAPLLQTLNLSSSKLPPTLFLHILRKTKINPQASLSFFNWAKSNLGFQPDLQTLVKLAQILIGSGLARQSKPILDTLVRAHPPARIVGSVIRECRGNNSLSPVLGSVLECYCKKGFSLKALEVYREAICCCCDIPISSCNALLDALQLENEIRLAWCCYGNMIRNRVLPDTYMWCTIARILCKDGKFERVVRILDMGEYNSVIYNLVVDCYSKNGNFRAAFDMLNEMSVKKLNPGFSTYSSILDGACKYGDSKVVEMTMGSMAEKGFLLKLPLSDCDNTIRKLSDLGKTYAMDMFYKIACAEGSELQGSSYGCMLRAFSKEGRVKQAIGVYCEMLERDIEVNENCYNALVKVLCKEDPSQEISGLLKDIIGRGFNPCALDLSTFVTSQCAKGRWRDVEVLLNAVLEKGFLPNSLCCSSLVKHYCRTGQVDLAIALHNKVVKMNGILDIPAYDMLLDGLIKERRVEEGVKVFDYMRAKELLSSASFSTIISGLCQEKELRKAMKMHDEMMTLGLKPDGKTYKRLISSFK